MSKLYNTISCLCQQNGIPITKLCTDIGISRSTLTELKAERTRSLSLPNMKKLSDYFRVNISYLESNSISNEIRWDEQGLIQCPQCGLLYYAPDDNITHQNYHEKWKKAVKYYGFCWNHSYRGAVKSYVYDNINTLPTAEAVQLGISFIQAYFSRSLENNQCDIDHPRFEDYCGAFLHAGHHKDSTLANIHSALTDLYPYTGLKIKGTYWYSEATLKEYSDIFERAESSKKQTKNSPSSTDTIDHTEELLKKHPELFRPKMKKVPILGGVACGEPIYSPNLDEEFALINEDIAADFALVCKGDSMIDVGINDGDVVFIRKQEIVDNGQIAAVVIGEEVTLKRVFYYRDKNKLVLHPANPNYEPLVYTGYELEEIRILGKAVAQLRKIR